jgi:hypothetical protein
MSAQAPVYENTNGVPLCDGKNLHMDVRILSDICDICDICDTLVLKATHLT